jgi:glycosyltransferase involved in cell wall biosynthesis
MRVVISSYDFLPNIGGVSTNVSILAAAFLDAGHEVTVVTSTPGPSDDYGYSVVREPSALVLFQLYRKADLLILSNLSLKLSYPLLLLRRPFALRHHSESAFKLSKSFFSIDILRRLVRSRAKHFVTSHYIGEVSGLREWVVTSPFANSLHMTPELVCEPPERNGVLFVGRLEPEKGVLFMLDRWPLIKRRLGANELRIAGDGSLTQAVRTRIAEGLADSFYIGSLSREETAREMGKAAYVLVPSLWKEPFGAVALEAVAAGAIPIVANRGGLAEAGGTPAFLFDPDDDESFAAALDAAHAKRKQILASDEAWAQYQREAAEHLSHFQPASVVQRIIETMSA